MAITISDLPEKVKLRSKRGDTVGKLIQINDAGSNPVDLTGRTFAAQLRRSPNSSSAVDVTVDTAGAATGQLVLRIASSVTETLSGDYQWDLEQTMGGTVRTIIEGSWTFSPDVTHE